MLDVRCYMLDVTLAVAVARGEESRVRAPDNWGSQSGIS